MPSDQDTYPGHVEPLPAALRSSFHHDFQASYDARATDGSHDPVHFPSFLKTAISNPLVDGANLASSKQKPLREALETSFGRSRGSRNTAPEPSAGFGAFLEEYSYEGYQNRRLALTAFSQVKGPMPERRPCIFFIHGGAFIRSDRYVGLARMPAWLDPPETMVVSIDYSLAPYDHSAPDTGLPGKETDRPLEDCYAAYQWLSANLDRLNIDPARIVVYGASAGGNLALGLVQLIKHRGEFAARHRGLDAEPCGLLLEAPQLDHRCDTESQLRFRDPVFFCRRHAQMSWRARLGPGYHSAAVSRFISPAAMMPADHAVLPPTYIDVGDMEPFADEVRSWAAAGTEARARAGTAPLEFSVWPGVPHGHEAICPSSDVSVASTRHKFTWIARMLQGVD